MSKIEITVDNHHAYDPWDYFVAAPGRGTHAHTMSFRVDPDFFASLEHLLRACPPSQSEPYFPCFHTVSDLARACLMLGYRQLVGVTQDQALEKEAAILSTSQLQTALSNRLATIDNTVKGMLRSIQTLIDAGADEEAERAWRQQREQADRLEGYAKIRFLEALAMFKGIQKKYDENSLTR